MDPHLKERCLRLLPWLVTTIALLGSLLTDLRQPGLGPIVFLSTALLFGLWHGALDVVLAHRQWHKNKSPPWWARLGLVYAFGMTAVALAWWLIPQLTFLGFLLLTAYHWGMGDAGWPRNRLRRVFGFSRGFGILFAASTFDPNTVSSLFTQVSGAQLPISLGAACFPFLIFCLFLQMGSAWITFRPGPDRYQALGDSLMITASFAFLPAYVAVALYFALFHAFRHIRRVSALSPLNGYSSLAVAICFLAAVGLGLLGMAFQSDDTPILVRLDTSYFQLLAMLTVPHAWIVRQAEAAGNLTHPASSPISDARELQAAP